MPAPSSFDYAVIRVVPLVEREEFVNAGVILFCRTRRYLAARIALDRDRLAALAPWLDLAEVERQLALIPLICQGDAAGGPIAELPISERFHWLVAPRSTVIETSPVHTGLSEDPETTLAHLVDTVVRTPDGTDTTPVTPTPSPEREPEL
ncbi:MAG: hypothetical protein QOF51_2911 [Chloroflexota bacterium]|jgi:hypothetical protein|nr:hypothetical protein [Chloroflexota bacterium]